MMALSKCVLDRVSERKNELKGRMYGQVEIMSRSVFARMDKRTSLYKDLLDQLVEQVFNKFTQQLNEAWRDGCAHGRDLESLLHQHIIQDEEYVLDSGTESLSISTFEPQASSSEQSLHECIHRVKLADEDDDDDDEEYYSIMAQMDGVDQCVLDRVEVRKNEFKDRAYGLVEIMSRTVFARMQKKTSLYKDLLDQLVEQVFNKFTLELNDAWRDGCAHGRDEWNVHLDFGESSEDQLEMNNLDSIEPLSSPHHSNEDSSLHTSPTPSQPSSQSQHQNFIQDDEPPSDSELMAESVPISSTLSKTSPQKEFQGFKIYEDVDEGEYNDDTCEEMMDICQNREQSEELDRDGQTTGNVSNLQVVNGQIGSDISEDVQHGNDEKMELNDKVDDEQVKNLDGTEVQKHPNAQSMPSGVSQASSQHLVREWSWNEMEKCWELLKNRQIDVVEGNDEVGEECDDEEIEMEDMDEDYQDVGDDEELALNDQVSDDEDSYEELNGLVHVKNLDEPSTEVQKHQLTRSIASGVSQSSSQHLVRECRIDDAKERVDDEIEANESSMKRWARNEVEKCWELMKNGQIDDDEGNDEVGEECDDDVCALCPKSFRTPSELKIHIQIHNGERPFKCNWKDCGMDFTSYKRLKSHNRTHEPTTVNSIKSISKENY